MTRRVMMVLALAVVQSSCSSSPTGQGTATSVDSLDTTGLRAKNDRRVPTGFVGEWTAEDSSDLRQALLDVRRIALSVQSGLVNASTATVTAAGSPTPRMLASRFADTVNVKDFGAVGGGTDDSAAFNAALALGKRVVVPDGHYTFGSTLTLGAEGTQLELGMGTLTSTASPAIRVTAGNTSIRGSGHFKTQLFVNSATADGIVASGPLSSLHIDNLAITCRSNSNTRTNGSAITLIRVGDYSLRNLYLRDPWVGLNLSGAASGLVDNVVMDTSLPGQSLYRGVVLADRCVGNHFHHVLVTSASTAVDTGWYVGRETDTLECVGCAVQASGAAGAAYGFRFETDGGAYAPRFIRLIAPYVEVDRTTGINYQLDHVTDCVVSQPYGTWGKYIYHVTPNAKTVKVFGGTAQLAYQYGVLIEGGDDILFDGMTISDSSQQANVNFDGVALAGGSHVKLLNLRSGNSIWAGASPASPTNFQRHGILTTGAVDYYWIVNNDLQNSLGKGGLHDTAVGAHKVVTGNL